METNRQTVTVAEFGRIIGIGRNSAYAAVQRGEVRSIKIGRRIVIPRAELDRILSGEIIPTLSNGPGEAGEERR